MEKEIFFLLNPDNFEETKKRKSYRTPQPQSTTMSDKVNSYLRLRSAIKRKLFSY